MEEVLGPWFHRFGPAGARRTRLFGFPHAGGGASSLLRLSRALEPDVEVLGVQYPGRQDRLGEPCVESLPDLAAQVTAEIRRLGHGTGDDGAPYALFGHSMGATVAFEVARRLTESGAAPAALFVSGRVPPQTPPHLGGRVLDDQMLLADLRRLGGTVAAVLDDPRMLSVLLPALRGDYRAVQRYRFDGDMPVLSCPVTALVGDADVRVSTEAVHGWADCTDGPFSCHVFPGGHFYVDDNVVAVAARVRSLLLGELTA